MHRVKNNVSSIQCGQFDPLTISPLHSQLSQAAHCSHNLKTERKCAACFWINYNFLVLTHLRRKRKYGITFENKTLKGLSSHFKNKVGLYYLKFKPKTSKN